MYLKERTSDDLVEVLDSAALFDPNFAEIAGRYHAGEEMQEETLFSKQELIFPSGESLPQCWLDPAYKG
jgi:hypothetical protein